MPYDTKKQNYRKNDTKSTINLINHLKNILKKDDRLNHDDKLLKNTIKELILNNDSKIFDLLFLDEIIKTKFFIPIGSSWIFKKDDFLNFLDNRDFLPNSYTIFKNKIGLTAGTKYLKERKDIQLSFPYKDCILEGGMSKDDEKARSEIFWNLTLASDEIDRLLEPKIFINFQQIGKKCKSIDKYNDGDNLIIRGNNLLALHSIKNRFTGKIKLIYIDPPYNKGGDSFVYNDRFNHSSWLTFMKNRLEVAQKLLHKDGSIFISIDQREVGYLLVLMDEIFGRENCRNIITVKRSSISGPKVINPGVVNLTEYILVYSKSKKWPSNNTYKSKKRDERYNKFIKNREMNYKKWEIVTLKEAYEQELGKIKSQKKYDLDQFVLDKKESIIRFANMDKDSMSSSAMKLKEKSLQKPVEIFHLDRGDKEDYYIQNGKVILFYEKNIMMINNKWSFSERISDIWDDVLPNDLHNEGGVTFRKGKKPEKLISRIIEIATNKNDIILDFFLGSGTTAAVAHKLGRQYIGIEQIDYGDNDCMVRMKNTINGEKSGISSSVNWHGGGNFVYCELMKLNGNFIEKINKAKTKVVLINIWKEMKGKAFLSHRLDIKKFQEKITEFKELDIGNQKAFLIETLDLNQLYLNYSEINDVDYKINSKIKSFNKSFYSGDLN